MMKILLFVTCLLTSIVSDRVDGIQNTLEEDLELERQLKLINKPSIKSIHTRFGDIIDCIDINKQPAFDHPLLKNHKLQVYTPLNRNLRKPNFQKSIGKKRVKNSSSRPIFGLEKDQYCPTGTVPIRRITKDDLIRGRSLLNSHIMTPELFGLHYAEVSPASSLRPFYGVSGTNSIFNPKVRTDQISASSVWVENNVSVIMAGWHVHPQLYGNDATYFYSAWTGDNAKSTGCYNILCPGFVQTHRGNYLGSRPNKTSIYGGVILEIPISIYQDPTTKNWWLSLGNTDVGYFPIELFNNLSSANLVGWGGRTLTPLNTPNPPMGSGHFPDLNFHHACYFRLISFKNSSRHDHSPTKSEAQTYADRTKCFDVSYYGDQAIYKYALQFGGPGGNCST